MDFHPVSKGYSKKLADNKYYNYASTNCNAKVLRYNEHTKRPKAVLDDSPDMYMKTNCEHNKKYLIIKLCEEINVNLIAIANYEYFSSSVKDFRVYASNDLSTPDWSLLGEFQALNNKEKQYFKKQHWIDNPRYYRHIKFEFLTHYGNEYYCTLSSIQAFGVSMMDDYRFVSSDFDILYAPYNDTGTNNINDAINHDNDDVIHAHFILDTACSAINTVYCKIIKHITQLLKQIWDSHQFKRLEETMYSYMELLCEIVNISLRNLISRLNAVFVEARQAARDIIYIEQVCDIHYQSDILKERLSPSRFMNILTPIYQLFNSSSYKSNYIPELSSVFNDVNSNSNADHEKIPVIKDSDLLTNPDLPPMDIIKNRPCYDYWLNRLHAPDKLRDNDSRISPLYNFKDQSHIDAFIDAICVLSTPAQQLLDITPINHSERSIMESGDVIVIEHDIDCISSADSNNTDTNYGLRSTILNKLPATICKNDWATFSGISSIYQNLPTSNAITAGLLNNSLCYHEDKTCVIDPQHINRLKSDYISANHLQNEAYLPKLEQHEQVNASGNVFYHIEFKIAALEEYARKNTAYLNTLQYEYLASMESYKNAFTEEVVKGYIDYNNLHNLRETQIKSLNDRLAIHERNNIRLFYYIPVLVIINLLLLAIVIWTMITSYCKSNLVKNKHAVPVQSKSKHSSLRMKKASSLNSLLNQEPLDTIKPENTILTDTDPCNYID